MPSGITATSKLSPYMLAASRGSPEDRKAMHYFRNFAASDLFGYLPGHFLDWLVLHGCEKARIVQHAVVALGVAHLEHCQDGSVSSRSTLAHQANLGRLRNYINHEIQLSHEVVLLCCILFFAFETLRKDMFTPDIHLVSGMSIVKSVHRKALTATDCQIPAPVEQRDAIRGLTVLFMELDIEATVQHVDRGSRLQVDGGRMSAVYSSSISSCRMRFFTPHEAMEPWMRICHDLWCFISGNVCYRRVPIDQVPEQVVQETNRLAFVMRKWKSAITVYGLTNRAIITETLSSLPRDDATVRHITDAISVLILDAHHFATSRFLAESLADDQMSPPFDRNPEELLSISRKVIALRQAHKDIRDIEFKQMFSTHVGLTEPWQYSHIAPALLIFEPALRNLFVRYRVIKKVSLVLLHFSRVMGHHRRTSFCFTSIQDIEGGGCGSGHRVKRIEGLDGICHSIRDRSSSSPTNASSDYGMDQS